MNRFFAAAVILTAFIGVTAGNVAAKEEKESRELFAMDTVMSFSAYGEHAKEGIDAAVSEIQRLDALLSTGSKDSEVAQINRRNVDAEVSGVSNTEDAETKKNLAEKTNAREPDNHAAIAGEAEQEAWNAGVKLSDDTAQLMEESLYLYHETDGAFDITIYPLMQLWGFTDKTYHVPTEEELAETLQRVGADNIFYDADARTVSFGRDGMEIDFGGIAKGYTSDRIMEIFRETGVTSGLVSLGGNVQALGTKPDGSYWKVGIQNPDAGADFLGIVKIADEAVITSGGYERYFVEDGNTYHHILDPKTGYPARSGLVSVTIVSPNGSYADGLSTSLFVMGEEKAIAFWQDHPDKFQMVLLTEDGRLLASEGLKDRLTSDYQIEWVAS